MSIFTHISSRRPKSSAFNLSHSRKFSFNPGIMVPTLCEEILPSDRWKYAMTALVRFQPLLSPMMHLVDVYNYSFFVPARLCMARNKFETFITGGKNGDGKDAQGNFIQLPYFLINRNVSTVNSASSLANEWLQYDLPDFLGCQLSPEGIIHQDGATIQINAMPFLAFWRIYCEYFRDQNLTVDWVDKYPGIFESSGDITAALYAALVTATGEDNFQFFSLPRVSWEKDYFTSALPFAQRGEPVETPLTGNATVTYKDPATLFGKTATTNAGAIRAGSLANAPLTFTEDTSGTNQPVGIDNIQTIALTSGGFTINQLRLATRLQEWLEKMARGGSRYIEQMMQHFGVKSSDARLQRSEFLGGGKIPVNISEVLQTSSDATTPLADMAGHGVSAGHINSFNKFFEEHGFVISIMFLRPRTAYQQGIRRVFTQRFDKLDWAWPSFAHLGEQEVLNKELYYTTDPAVDNAVFGYQSRYAEYKYIPSTVHADFRDSLNFWHWGRIFEDQPTLSREFVESDPSNRVFNVTVDNTESLYCIVSNRITAIRPLPYFGEPTL